MDDQARLDRIIKEKKEMEDAAKHLKEIIKQNNHKSLIEIILSHSNRQLQMIKNRYQVLYKQYLSEDLISNFDGDFLELIIALTEDTYIYESTFMNEAIENIGEDEKLICQLLCTKDPKEINLLKSAYKLVYKRDLEKDILNNRDGDKNNLYYSLASGKRNENNGYDIETVKKDAQKLLNACQEKVNEDVFINILTTVSYPQLYATFACFEELANENIESVVRKNLKGNLKKACLTMIKTVQNKACYFADILNESMVGLGTDDKTLIRILVTRHEIDLHNIKQEYKLKYRKTLKEDIKGDTSGKYKKCLEAIVDKAN